MPPYPPMNESQEQTLVPPLTWLALAAVALLMASVGAWMFLGTIPRKVDGNGVLLRDSEYGIFRLAAERDGSLASVEVTIGDLVEAGQAVAHWRTPLPPGQEEGAIRSPLAGRVIEVVAGPGKLMRTGETILRLESPSGEYEALLYVSALEGKQVAEGMEARLIPTTLSPVGGYLKARVSYVSPHPVTLDYLLSELGGNRRLAKWLLDRNTCTEVVVSLERAPSSADGYDWSTGKPGAKIESGLLLHGEVIFDRVRPVTWLLSPDRE